MTKPSSNEDWDDIVSPPLSTVKTNGSPGLFGSHSSTHTPSKSVYSKGDQQMKFSLTLQRHLGNDSAASSSSLISRTSSASGMKRPDRNSRSKSSCSSSQSCMEVYGLFKRCSTNSIDNISCGVAVANYAKCALNEC
eukprot:CAMPEP_0172322190 /NCGR_PEP_ID=MMETSP1058-20130122/45255_1 /TAXON_ID=83371 /ORGANISM="Detonula confervacea, Strain CCMP 353" /LENGTH=136 /DNA_ID=CAMNT_0013037861 /DNA_START=81 /DNA_END=491 /DNA_ORIENTATION=-